MKSVPTTEAEEVAESLNRIEGDLCGLHGLSELLEFAIENGEGRIRDGVVLLTASYLSDQISEIRQQIGDCVNEIRK